MIDPAGLHLHNAFFASAASGCAATPGAWWWSTYIDRLHLYASLFGPIARFVSQVNWLLPEWEAVTASASSKGAQTRGASSEVKVVATAGYDGVSGTAIVWVQHPNSTWSWVNGSCSIGPSPEHTLRCGGSPPDDPEAVFPRTPMPMTQPTFKLTFMAQFWAGRKVNVAWFDTWAGKNTVEETAQVDASGQLELRVPGKLWNDTAAIVTA